jgi:hypothetical protein
VIAEQFGGILSVGTAFKKEASNGKKEHYEKRECCLERVDIVRWINGCRCQRGGTEHSTMGNGLADSR